MVNIRVYENFLITIRYTKNKRKKINYNVENEKSPKRLPPSEVGLKEYSTNKHFKKKINNTGGGSGVRGESPPLYSPPPPLAHKSILELSQRRF